MLDHRSRSLFVLGVIPQHPISTFGEIRLGESAEDRPMAFASQVAGPIEN